MCPKGSKSLTGSNPDLDQNPSSLTKWYCSSFSLRRRLGSRLRRWPCSPRRPPKPPPPSCSSSSPVTSTAFPIVVHLPRSSSGLHRQNRGMPSIGFDAEHQNHHAEHGTENFGHQFGNRTARGVRRKRSWTPEIDSLAGMS
ncbi:hypothetical protein Droror1_Dr00009068 [Drosera rotundifolia]